MLVEPSALTTAAEVVRQKHVWKGGVHEDRADRKGRNEEKRQELSGEVLDHDRCTGRDLWVLPACPVVLR